MNELLGHFKDTETCKALLIVEKLPKIFYKFKSFNGVLLLEGFLQVLCSNWKLIDDCIYRGSL